MSSGYESEGRIDATKEDLSGDFAFLRDNDYVFKGYRMALTLKETIISIFQFHNETLNIWTHYGGALIFIFLIFYSLSPYYLQSGQSILSTAPYYMIEGRHTLHMFQTIYEIESNNMQCVNIKTNEKGLYEKYGELLNILSSTKDLSKEEEELIDSVDPFFSSWYYGDYSIETQREFAKENTAFIKRFYEAFKKTDAYKQYKLNNNSTVYPYYRDDSVSTIQINDAIHELYDFSTSYSKYVDSKVSRWPLIVFLCSAIFCMTGSATYHSFFVLNSKASDLLQTLDYLGISVLICGSYVPIIYYAFICEPFYSKLYLSMVFILNAINVIVMITPKCRTPEYRKVRSTCFVVVASFAWIPIGHLILTHQLDNPIFSVAFKYIMLMAFTYVLGAFFYGSRVPERFFPGKFDYGFYSHALFHVCIVVAALFHFVGSWKMYKLRLFEGC